MTLTNTQLQTLKTDIQANVDATVVQALADGNIGAVKDWYNQTASPDYYIYRDKVESEEIRDAINANNIVNITTADLERTQALLEIRAERGFSGADVDDRAAWDDVFSATAGDQSQQAIAALWSRLATNAEKVFALSTGNGAAAATADTTEWQGTLSLTDVSNALNS